MSRPGSNRFDPVSFLSQAGQGRNLLSYGAKEVLFSQGAAADSTFYIQTGNAKLTVVANSGKEATITLLAAGDFVGEESVTAVVGLRVATATAISSCRVLKIDRATMIRALHEERAFSDFFLAFLLARNGKTQADLVDHLFNRSEKRLARVLLQMAEGDKIDGSEILIPPITQESLAEMVGTTRSRVSFFMNRFRRLGFIEYSDRIRVRPSLTNVVLHD